MFVSKPTLDKRKHPFGYVVSKGQIMPRVDEEPIPWKMDL